MINKINKRKREIENKMTTKKSKTEKKNVIIYCRISSPKQSLDSQEYACKQYCIQFGLNIIKIVHEVGSAWKKKLILLDKIINNNNNISILIYSADRFSRNTLDATRKLDILLRKNINIISVNDNIDISTLNGRHHFRQLISSAELESDIISDRVKRSVVYNNSIDSDYGKCINEQCVVKFIVKFLNNYHSSIHFTNELYTILSKYEKPQDFYVSVVFEKNDIIYDFMKINEGMIADIFNDYEILKRNKKWTRKSIKNIYNNAIDINILNEQLNDFKL